MLTFSANHMASMISSFIHCGAVPSFKLAGVISGTVSSSWNMIFSFPLKRKRKRNRKRMRMRDRKRKRMRDRKRKRMRDRKRKRIGRE